MAFRKPAAPAPAYTEHSASATYSNTESSTEELLGVDKRYPVDTKYVCHSPSEDFPDDDHTAPQTRPSQLLRSDSKSTSSTDSLLTKDYAETSLGPKPKFGSNSSSNVGQNPKFKFTLKTIKKPTLEKQVVKHALVAGCAGLIEGKKELDRVNSCESSKTRSSKYAQVILAAASEGRRVFDVKQATKKPEPDMLRIEDEYDVRKGKMRYQSSKLGARNA